MALLADGRRRLSQVVLAKLYRDGQFRVRRRAHRFVRQARIEAEPGIAADGVVKAGNAVLAAGLKVVSSGKLRPPASVMSVVAREDAWTSAALAKLGSPVCCFRQSGYADSSAGAPSLRGYRRSWCSRWRSSCLCPPYSPDDLALFFVALLGLERIRRGAPGELSGDDVFSVPEPNGVTRGASPADLTELSALAGACGFAAGLSLAGDPGDGGSGGAFGSDGGDGGFSGFGGFGDAIGGSGTGPGGVGADGGGGGAGGGGGGAGP